MILRSLALTLILSPVAWGDRPDPKDLTTIKDVSGAKVSLQIAKDAHNVYYVGDVIFEKIPGADPASFEVIGDSSYSLYSKDKKNVYSDFHKVEGADPATFSLLKEGKGAGSLENYGRDKNSVFYRERKIVGADPSTFSLLSYCEGADFGGPPYSKDKNAVYIYGKKVEGADAASFKLVDCAAYYRPGGDRVDAQDKTRAYKLGKVVKK